MRRSFTTIGLAVVAVIAVLLAVLGQVSAAPPSGDPVPNVEAVGTPVVVLGGQPDGDGIPGFGGGFPTPTPNIPVSTSFTYQGRVNFRGQPVSGQCDMRFTLHDRSVGGDQIGPTLNQTNTVNDGLFTTALNFGASSFTGDARYLRIAVSCPPGGDLEPLTPSQQLTAAPYALGLRPGTHMVGQIVDGPILDISNADVGGIGLHADGRAVGVHGEGTSLDSIGVLGESPIVGVQGEATQYGVVGKGARGVQGESDYADGAGVYGIANGGDHAWGVVGGSENGTGVFGRSRNNVGVCGDHKVATGWSDDCPNGPYGVYGRTFSTAASAAGVVGEVTSTSPGSRSAGVRGISNGTGSLGIGVHGSQEGSGWGVYGETPSGRGVYGETVSGTAIYGNATGSGRAGYFSGDVHITDDLTKSYGATSSRALPVAFAFINSTGSVNSGTGNVTSTWVAANDRYEITISGETYLFNDYVTVVTPTSATPLLARTSSVSGRLIVQLYNLQGTAVQGAFQFVTYKP